MEDEINGRQGYKRDWNGQPICLECVDCKIKGELGIAFNIINGKSVCDEHLKNYVYIK